MKKLHIFILILININLLKAQQLVVYPNISGNSNLKYNRAESDKYKVKIMFADDQKWLKSFVGQTTSLEKIVSGGKSNGYIENLKDWSASWSTFEFNEKLNKKVVVEISNFDGSAIINAKVRPQKTSHTLEVKDGKAYITIDKNANFNVDINNQMEGQYTGYTYAGKPVHTITIFANPIYTVPTGINVRKVFPGEDIPNDIKSGDIIYFQKGVHRFNLNPLFENKTIYNIVENTTIFIPGDVIIHGGFSIKGWDKANNFTVIGSGVLSGEEKIHQNYRIFEGQSTNTKIEGVLIIDSQDISYHIQNTKENDITKKNIYNNIKTLSWRVNSDSINPFSNSEITNSFFRCQDDVISYGFNNVVYKNITTWNDANGSVVIFHGSNPDQSIAGIDGLNVIYHRRNWHAVEEGRILSFHFLKNFKKDGNNIIDIAEFNNINIKNVLIEDPFPAFYPFSFVFDTNLTDKSKSMKMKNIYFENIKMLNKPQDFEEKCKKINDKLSCPNKNLFKGFNESNILDNITFKNVSVNSEIFKELSENLFEKNEFIGKNIKFLWNCDLDLQNQSDTRGKISPNPGKYTFTNGDKVTLKATPNIGFKFTGWENYNNKIISSNKNYEFNIIDDVNLKATYNPSKSIVSYNPVTKSIFANIDWNKENNLNLLLYNFNGKLIELRKIKVIKGFNKIEIKDLKLETGYYILQIFDNDTKETIKFLVN